MTGETRPLTASEVATLRPWYETDHYVTPGSCVGDARRLLATIDALTEKLALVDAQAEELATLKRDAIGRDQALDLSLRRLDQIASYVGTVDYIDSIGPILDAIDAKVNAAKEPR
jgi:hypothetical protein